MIVRAELRFGPATCFILSGTLLAPSATLVGDAITDKASRSTVRPGTVGASRSPAVPRRRVGRRFAHRCNCPALGLAHAPGAAQRHGRADAVAQNAGAGLDRAAPGADEISNPIGPGTHVGRALPEGKPDSVRLGRGDSVTRARSQSDQPPGDPAAVGSRTAPLSLPGLPQPGGTKPAVLGVR